MAAQFQMGRCQPGVYTRQGAAIRLVLAACRIVAAGICESDHFIGNKGQFGRYAELCAHRVNARQIISDHGFGGARQSLLHCVGIDKRIAVPVAADPASQFQEIGKPCAQNLFPLVI